MRADRSATSGAGLFISGLSLGAAGSDVLPGSSGIDAREVDVGVDAADDCAQHDENQQNDQSDKHGVVSVRRQHFLVQDRPELQRNKTAAGSVMSIDQCRIQTLWSLARWKKWGLPSLTYKTTEQRELHYYNVKLRVKFSLGNLF